MQLPTSTQLRLARVALDLKVVEAADQSGVNHTSLYRAETGATDPRASTLRKLHDFYTSRGVEFGPDGWVRLRPIPTETTKG